MHDQGRTGWFRRSRLLYPLLTHAIDFLPTQAIIENFVHHNPLHHFEDEPFHATVAEAGRAIGMRGYASEAYFEERLAAGAITVDALRYVLQAALPTLPPVPRLTALDALVALFTAADPPRDAAAFAPGFDDPAIAAK